MLACACSPLHAAGLCLPPACAHTHAPHHLPAARDGTQFCGEALNVRQGRKRSTYTGKELKKDIERFLETGLVSWLC